MKFHVGDRVRIVKSPKSWRVGCLATVVEVTDGWRQVGADIRFGTRHRLDVDGVGTRGEDGRPISYFSDELEPIDDRPEAGSWDEICALTRGWRPGVEVHS